MLGLLLFSLLLLLESIVHSLLVLPFLSIGDVHASPIIGHKIINISLIPDFLELIALSIFLYLARK